MNEWIGVFLIFGLLLLWEVEKIRKDTAHMRLTMERDSAAWREASQEIVAIGHMLEKEIARQSDNRLSSSIR